MLDRLRRLFQRGATTANSRSDPSDTGFMLRSLDLAKQFPTLFKPNSVPKYDLRVGHECPECHVASRHVVVTTWGWAGDPDTWRAHPVAMDGLACPNCDTLFCPARLTPEMAADLNRTALAAVKAGDLDQAEFLFRRLVNSYPDGGSARMSLGSVYLDKRRAAQAAKAPPELIHLFGERTHEIYLSILQCPDPVHPHVFLTLARISRAGGDTSAALRYVGLALASPQCVGAFLTDARSLETQLQSTTGAGA